MKVFLSLSFQTADGKRKPLQFNNYNEEDYNIKIHHTNTNLSTLCYILLSALLSQLFKFKCNAMLMCTLRHASSSRRS
jgi:hypothetical protein